MTDCSVIVRVPADPRYVRVVRMVAHRSAANAGLTYDRIENLALAINEAAGELLRLDGGKRIEGRLIPEEGGLRVSLGVDIPTDTWPPDDWEGSLGSRVLDTVAGDVEFASGDGESSLELVVG